MTTSPARYQQMSRLPPGELPCGAVTPGVALSGERRPRLNPALRLLWRSPNCLQIGVDPTRAVVLDGMNPVLARALLDMDGARTEREVLDWGASQGVDRRQLSEMLAGLTAGNALLDGVGEPQSDPVPRGIATGVAPRLGPDHASLSLLTDGSDPTRLLHNRRASRVVVHGAGRIGGPLATLLAAGGVGAVNVVDEARCDPASYAPGGISAPDAGRSRSIAAHDAVHRYAPETDTATAGDERVPDLVVFATCTPVDPVISDELRRLGVAHLGAGVREHAAVIGPLVIPGETSCLRCADLHRTDRDRAWPVLALQLSDDPRGHVTPCDVVLAATCAAMAAMQALMYLDGIPVPTRDGTLELRYPHWQVRRRSWPPHPDCDCLRASRIGDELGRLRQLGHPAARSSPVNRPQWGM